MVDNRKPLVPKDTPKAPNFGHRVPITAEQREVFLKSLRENGVVAWASRLAGRSRSGFEQLKKRDPEFAKQWEDAIEEATGVVEHEAFRRAVHGTERVEVSGGQIVYNKDGTPLIRKEYSDSLMAMMLKARIQSFATRQYHEVNHKYSQVGAVLTHEDIGRLSEDEQDQLLTLLGRIEELKKHDGANAQGQIEDAEFTDGEEDDDLDAQLAQIL